MKISCIIPTYNEGERILPVLDVICNNSLIDEVIVVNDGSRDNTSAILIKDKRIKFISYTKNMGKTHAVVLGIKSSRNDVVMTIDADLIGLQKENIDNLILPILSQKADVSISIRGNALAIYKKIGIDSFSGERVFRKDIFGDIDVLSKSLKGFGLETYMDKIIVKNKFKIKIVNWPDVFHARKQEKIGYWKGMYGEFLMILQIFKTLNFFALVKLILKMRKLRIAD